MSDIKKRLTEMAKLSVLANRMNEIQEKNLKMYPFVFFNDVKSVKVDYNLSKVDDDGKMNHKNHHVTYYLELDENLNKDNLDKRFLAIAKATQTLFWNDLKVNVFINDKLSYESVKNNV